MNARFLSPFLVSFVLAAAWALGSDAKASQGNAMESFTSPLSAHRSSSVDASGKCVAAPEAQAGHASVAPASSQQSEKPEAPVLHSLDRDAVLASLQAQISSHFNLEGDLQLELLRPWTEIAPSEKPVALVVLEYPSQASSSMLLRARIESAGKPGTELSLTLRAQLWRDAWSTRQPVSRNDVFDASVLELRRIDVLRERDALLHGTVDSNYSFSRPVPTGRLLSWRDVEPRALVRKGEYVEVAAVDGPISVVMRALALQNGAAGETISVRNLASKKDISVQVVGEKRVLVRF